MGGDGAGDCRTARSVDNSSGPMIMVRSYLQIRDPIAGLDASPFSPPERDVEAHGTMPDKRQRSASADRDRAVAGRDTDDDRVGAEAQRAGPVIPVTVAGAARRHLATPRRVE